MTTKTATLITLLSSLSIIAAACGASSGTEADVRPFSEVQATEITFENDPTFNGRGIFRVKTTEPLICAIVWGETEELGNFNDSLAMNGTGIIRHDVLLPGADPGKTYYYRIQGSGADGTLYQSELATFTLPEAGAASTELMVDHGTNLAPCGTITDVSSEFSDAWAASNAIDGDLGSEWASKTDGSYAYLVINLGSVQDVGGVEFITRSMLDGSAITTEFTVTVDDGTVHGPLTAGTPAEPVFAELFASGTEFRFDVNDSIGGNTGAIEINIYAP
jgi:hypothetical protein